VCASSCVFNAPTIPLRKTSLHPSSICPSLDMPLPSDPDQCALDENGQLKDAEDIQWFNSPGDKNPIPLPPVEEETVTDNGGMSHIPFTVQLLIPRLPAPHGRPQRNKNSGIQSILAAERLNEWGDLDKRHRQPKRHAKRNTKRAKVMDSLSDLDPDDASDDEYQTDRADSASEVSNTSEGNISNEEVRCSFVLLWS
jgi:hypothetical protein